MNIVITERQVAILAAIIKEFMETALPVGSTVVAERYKVKASPATIRNEMVSLANMGYLEKNHFSAGRIPTSIGFRYYIDRIMLEEDLNYIEEVAIRQELHRQRFAKDKLVKSAVDSLAEHLKYAVVAIADDGVFYSGIAEMLDYQEFHDLDNLRNILSIIENYEMLENVFKKVTSDSDIKILVGDEAGFRAFDPCAIVYSRFDLYNGQFGYISVIGPMRMIYSQVIPWVRFTSDVLSSVTRGW